MATRKIRKYYICNGLGDSLDAPSREQMFAFLYELDPADEEHGAAWLSNNEDSLEWEVTDRIVYTRGDDRPPRHLQNVSKEAVVELWVALAEERFDDLEREPWQPGNGYVLTPEKRAEIAASQLKMDREFYDLLGDENPDRRCKHPGCLRGSIRMSVLCRPHHFESIRQRPSPFNV